MNKSMKKAVSMILAAGCVASLTITPVMAADEHQPGFEVYYREGDPTADIDVEITSEDQIEWTVACCVTEENPQSVAVANIAKDLEELTDGKFTWDVFYNSELGSETEVVELCRNNTVQFVTSNVTTM